MAVPSMRTFSSYGRSGGAKNWMGALVAVDATSVDAVLDGIEDAISPYSLLQFMIHDVAPYLSEQIVDVFAGLGNDSIPGGGWAPLEDSTLKIRHALGYWDDYAINERSGDLLHYLTHSHDIQLEAFGSSITVPGDTTDPILWKKLKVAQEGWTQGANEMLPGAVTPARPILGLNDADLMAVTAMLQVHIVNWVSNGFLAMGTI
jgi:hypothetical protein